MGTLASETVAAGPGCSPADSARSQLAIPRNVGEVAAVESTVQLTLVSDGTQCRRSGAIASRTAGPDRPKDGELGGDASLWSGA
jgi:hypothetical protein